MRPSEMKVMNTAIRALEARDPPGRHHGSVHRARRRGGSRRSGRFDLVVIGASFGGWVALREIVCGIPDEFPLSIAVVVHRSRSSPNLLHRVLRGCTALRVQPVTETGVRLEPGTVHVAASDQQLRVVDGAMELVDGDEAHGPTASAVTLYESAAKALDGRVIAVVPWGIRTDATEGIGALRKLGGFVIAQDRAAAPPPMAAPAVAAGEVDMVLPIEEIAPMLTRLATGTPPHS
jgi:two-component system chemotaxis response regulator CheB